MNSDVTILTGIQTFIWFVCTHWVGLTIAMAVLITVFQCLRTYKDKSTDEQIEIAWNLISKQMLIWVSAAEAEWGASTGKIKRAMVLQKVFEAYPILGNIADQEAVLEKIDELIDLALEQMKEILATKASKERKE